MNPPNPPRPDITGIVSSTEMTGIIPAPTETDEAETDDLSPPHFVKTLT